MGKKTILIVDDEDFIRSFVSSIFVSKGFQVLEASGGEDALAILQRPDGSVDALVTDVKMPGMTGIELANAVMELNKTMPVVFMSGYWKGDEHGTFNHPQGAVAFVDKPFTVKTMLDALNSVLPPARGSARVAGSSN